MAIGSFVNLTQSNAAGSTSQNTASVTLASGRDYRLAVGQRLSGGTPAVPTCSGWTQLDTRTTSEGRITTFTRTGDGSTAAQTIAVSSADTRIYWSIDEYQGGDHSTLSVQDNGSVGTGTGIATTLSAFASANNGLYIAAISAWAVALTAEAGCTRLSTQVSAQAFATFWRVGEDTSPSAVGGLAGQWFCITADEVKEAAAAVGGDGSRGVVRGVARGIGRGLASAMTMVKDGLLYRPRETRLVVPVGIAL